MSTFRIFVEKKEPYRVEAESLRRELNSNLGLNIKKLRLLNVYDLFGFAPSLIEKARYGVFGEIATDVVSDNIEYDPARSLAVEYLPGQFDLRAASAEECVKLIEPSAEVEIRSGQLMIFDETVDEAAIEKIAHYCINPVESRRKKMSRLAPPERAEAKPVEVLAGFRDLTHQEATQYCRSKGLAMNGDDLMEVVNYFRSEERDPNETELRILDTYWSDHCRHTTFMSELTDIKVEDSFSARDIKKMLEVWHDLRRELHREHKPLCLMDLATIGARYLAKTGVLDNQEQSEENNACSIYVDLEVDGKPERWLLQFKNETHNHPTEIEPFGGASTCLGGAIRDPLSGRSYVYQAMRVTGAGNIYAPVEEAMEGKLPQRNITLKAAAGYSSYGNQIGLATTHVREIYHPGYEAKRMEVGAVVGAVKAADVRRESPAPGDIILMFGGRTGRDGIGGATGSSKEHNTSSLEECGSEVQKGNAPEERKIERLFRRPEVTRLIKKSNDFGAGGVSVAIGELADGLDIYLDRVTTKYSGLNATELAISESQERMSVVIEAEDREEFEKYCAEENLEVRHIADVTDSGRMRMYYNGELVADLSREFINSAGARHYAKATIGCVPTGDPSGNRMGKGTIRENILQILADPNVTSQKGLIEMFDSSIGASTVLMPMGGKTQRTETQVSAQKLPVEGKTDTASVMSFGFNPYISEWSPFHGAAYAVLEAVAKVVASGADYRKMRFSYQEYFEKMTSELAWGKPLAALLGALKMQLQLGLPSIGGKDSMSGTFANIHVPPTLIAFGITTADARKIISPEFKKAGDSIYLITIGKENSGMPDAEKVKRIYPQLTAEIERGNVKAAYAVGFGGVAEALAKMSFGNEIGVDVTVDHDSLFGFGEGSIVIECEGDCDIEDAVKLGVTTANKELVINGEIISIKDAFEANRGRFTKVYPDCSGKEGDAPAAGATAEYPDRKGEPIEHPVVCLPVFPGTNCDYDMARAFRREGAETEIMVFRNLTPEDVENSAAELAAAIDRCNILALSGGFSSGDEPDGSGKFIATVLLNDKVKAAVERLQAREGLILGICNGFQALVKSGLLPFGRLGDLHPDSPTLFRNDINRHISQIVTTRVGSVKSPWLKGFRNGQLHSVAASHGEGRFVADEKLATQLLADGQIAFQYADSEGNATMTSPYNPNGSTMAIEGIISPDGRILGKMGHSERYTEGLMKNIPGDKNQNIFRNAVNYFRNSQSRN